MDYAGCAWRKNKSLDIKIFRRYNYLHNLRDLQQHIECEGCVIMRRNIYVFLAMFTCSSLLMAGCGKREESRTDTSVQQEVSAENDSLEEDSLKEEDSSETESSSKNETTSEETSSEQGSTSESATTAGSKQDETTTPPSGNDTGKDTGKDTGEGNNTTGNHDNTGSNNSSGNNNNTTGNNNSSGGNNVVADNGGNVLADKNGDKVLVTYHGITTGDENKLAQAVLKKIIKNGMSEFEKAKAIHDYMVMNIDYDYANYLANTIPSSSYTIEGALKNKYAVCSGYAKAFMLLCQSSGLQCTYVTGTAGGPHAWNQIRIDGKWYNVDVTWDDPVSVGKAFNDHTFNRYSYFLISDELMSKDHKAESDTHSCPSSLNMKAYEVGAPWSNYTYIKNDADFKATVQKVIKANATSISLTWDTKWIKSTDMSKKVKSMMLECDIADDFYIASSIGHTIKNTNLYAMTYQLELKKGVYSPSGKIKTKDEAKNLIKSLKNGGEITVPMVNALVNKDVFYELSVWAYKNLNLTVHLNETQVPVNSTAKSVYIFVQKNPTYSEETYYVEKISEVDAKVAAFSASGKSFRMIYRYGDELGRLSGTQIKSYIEKNKAPTWASKYCYENYSLSYDEQLCIVSIRFNMASHSTANSKWEYEKVPTCVSDGYEVLKCHKCKCVTQRIKVEATGVHDTSWVYESDTAKHLKCKNCTYTGKTEHKYGNIWGYFDDNAAGEFFKEINKSRETAVYYHIGPMGEYIGQETPPQLIHDATMSQQLRSTVIDICTEIASGKGFTPREYIAVNSQGSKDAYFACGNLFISGVYRDYLESIYLKRAGVACFYFDMDGTGLKVKPIWCVHFAE